MFGGMIELYLIYLKSAQLTEVENVDDFSVDVSYDFYLSLANSLAHSIHITAISFSLALLVNRACKIVFRLDTNSILIVHVRYFVAASFIYIQYYRKKKKMYLCNACAIIIIKHIVT